MSAVSSSSLNAPNGHTMQHATELDRLASCTTCPSTIDYKKLTDELRANTIDQKTAEAVLKKFIEWKEFEGSLLGFETVSLISQEGRAVPIPVLALLLRSASSREKFKESIGDITCYETPQAILQQVLQTLTSSTAQISASDDIKRKLGLLV